MKTTAAVLKELNKPLQIEELTIPELNRGQVLVKILYSGICHTQLNEIRGLKGEDRFLPHTLGHEGSGIIEEIGASVKKVKPGDHVVLTWIKGEGMDVPSARYTNGSNSAVNSGAISTLMSRAVVSENRVVRIPEEIPLRESSLFGCSIPTGMGVIFNTLRAEQRHSVAVLGLGGVGMSAVVGAHVSGCKKIIAVDVKDWKLDLARKLGATDVLNAGKYNLGNYIKDVSGGQGIDFVVEAAGLPETMETGLSLIHNRGTVVIAGNVAAGQKIMIDPFDLIKGKKIIGTWGGETRPDTDIPLYMKSIFSKGLKLDALISRQYRLEDINQAFSDLEKGNLAKALVDFSR